MPGDYGEPKLVTAVMASGATTSSGIWAQGYRHIAISIPVLTSAATLQVVGEFTGGSFVGFTNSAGALVTFTTPGGTGGVIALPGSLVVPGLAAFHGQLRISASVAQAADRNFIWHLKG